MQLQRTNLTTTVIRNENANRIEKLCTLSTKVNKNYFLTALAISLIDSKIPQSTPIICSLSHLNCVRIITQSDIEPKTKVILSSVHLVGLVYCLSQLKFS